MITAGKTYQFYGDQVVTVHEVTGGFEDHSGSYVEVRATYLRKDGKPGSTGIRLIPATATEVEGRPMANANATVSAQTDAEWLYGNSPAGLRMQAAQELAAEFGTDVEEWLI